MSRRIAVRRSIFSIAVFLGGVAIVLLARAAVGGGWQPSAESLPGLTSEIAGRTPEKRLGQAIRLGSNVEGALGLLMSNFPRAFSQLQTKTYPGGSLLLRLPGSDSGLKPQLFLSHLDVVSTESEQWSFPPALGEVREGWILGRGTLDDRVGVWGWMEALEFAIEKGFKSKRTLYWAFGHDEETGGNRGASVIAADLEKQGLRFEAVWDEGMTLVQDMVPGTDRPVALIGVAEKGYLDVEVTLKGKGGHSSVLSERTVIERAAEAIGRLKEQQPSASLGGALESMFQYLGPEMEFGYRLIFQNLWLTQRLVVPILNGSPSSAALLRTIWTVTQIKAGVARNVVPKTITFNINSRLNTGDTAKRVIQNWKDLLQDLQPEFEVIESKPPSAVSSADTESYRAIAHAVVESYPNAIVAPGLLLAGTDSHHFEKLADHVYRFLPVLLHEEDIDRFHGIDEKVLVKNYHRAIAVFYRALGRMAN